MSSLKLLYILRSRSRVPLLSSGGFHTHGPHALQSSVCHRLVHADRSAELRWRKVQFSRLNIRVFSTTARREDGNLIYTGNLGSVVRGVKMFSYTTSATSLILMPQILLKTGLGVQSLALQVAFCGVVGFFTFLTPVLLHLVTRGYVMRLYHRPDSDSYTVVTCSVFLTERRRVFHQSQVRIPAVSSMFTSFYAGPVGLLVNPDLFPVQQDYNHLMGYDKPFSFSADDVEQPDSS